MLLLLLLLLLLLMLLLQKPLLLYNLLLHRLQPALKNNHFPLQFLIPLTHPHLSRRCLLPLQLNNSQLVTCACSSISFTVPSRPFVAQTSLKSRQLSLEVKHLG